ncbi:cell wall-binding repeat-containing protein [Salinibacterium soli]|uniref:Cell wall-binding repeat-containing protein n=1 Tax=Antiquaquibacter soli TaxID=3064523 RepID=A0ABT9BQQ2_9MICO|nr:cell wall-binding repeat-containing protein [Protaetiibacter sp. WY-16]MDO7883368.1 cell wall-binding repeat-containing protein [Protaetiibacter sp. WY-16]
MPARTLSRAAAVAVVPLLAAGMLVASPLTASGVGVLDTIPVGDTPRFIAFSSDSSTAYVTNRESDTVTVIDVAAATGVGTIPVGDQPLGISTTPDGSEVWVGNWGSTTISIIDTATDSVVTTINSGGSGPHAIDFTSDGAIAYVTNYFNGVVAKIDVATRAVVDFYDYTGYPEGAALSADESALYVTDTNADQLLKLDTATMEPIGSGIPVGDFPVEAELSPDGTEIWVTNNSDAIADTVSVVSVATDTEVATIPVGGYPTDILFAGGLAYVTTSDTDSLEQISIATRQVIGTIPVGESPFGVAQSPDGAHLYVANQYDDTVTDLGIEVDRIAGADRFDVAVNISQTAFPSGSANVFIATGLNYPDALSAGPTAGVFDAPLLLTNTDALPPAVVAEIQRLGATHAVIVGGPASVSDAVFDQLTGLVGDGNVERLSGADRYEASRNIVDYGFDDVDSIYITTGRNFPDALSAGAAGAGNGTPVLLVDGLASSVDPVTLALIASLTPSTIQIAGGPASVSPQIESQLSGLYPVERRSGADRYAASISINAAAFDVASHAFLATGLKFPDALAGSSLAAGLDAPLYVVPTTCVPAGVLSELERLHVSRVTLLGGPVSLTPAVEDLTGC